MEKVKLAVIGGGQMGARHAELICASNACRLVGLCDVDPRGQAVASRFGVPFYRTAEELLDRERPAGAIVATPNAEHVASAEVCARRSVHVLVEKPVADTLAAAQRLVSTAAQCGIRVLVGHHRRHSPLTLTARRLVRDGALGKLVGVSALWAVQKPDAYYQTAWRCERPGGGPTLINLIHELDSLRFICGEVQEVYAQVRSGVRGLAVEDSVSISLSFENGALGTILASDATPSPWSYEAAAHENRSLFPTDESCYYFLGSAASLSFPRMELWRYADAARQGWQHPLAQSRQPVPEGDPLEAQLAHFCQVVKGEAEPVVDGRDGARSLAVALAVLESARTGRPVDPRTLT